MNKDIQSLTKLLQEAVLAIAKFAKEGKIKFPYRFYQVMWMEPVPGKSGSSTGKYEERKEPAFFWIDRQTKKSLSELPSVKEFLTEAGLFAKNKGKLLPVEFRQPEEIAHTLLGVYLDRVGGFKVKIKLMEKVCEEYVNDLQDSKATITTVFLVRKFNALKQFKLSKEILFRPINHKDIDKFGRGQNTPWPSGTSPWLGMDDWICEVKRRSPKNTMEIYNQNRELLEWIVGALGLSVEGRSSFSLLANYWSSPILDNGTTSGGKDVVTSGIGGAVTLDDNDVKLFRLNYRKVSSLMTNNDNKFRELRLPFRRLRQSSARLENEDRLVDYVIGLENLLARDSDNLEVTFRFRLRGAALLPDSFGGIRERINFMNKLYSLRSHIVHGSASESEVNDFLARAEEALKVILLWYFNSLSRHESIKEIISKLDESLVSGGEKWAYPKT